MAITVKFFGFGVVTLALICLGYTRPSFAEQPIDQVKNTVERIAQVLQEPSADSDSHKAETAEKIRQILLPQFDFAEMAKRSLGNYWKGLDGKQNEFVGTFSAFVEHAYMGTLESYKGEKIIYLREQVDRDLAQVDTQVVPSKGDPFSVSYRLHLVESDWKVYDVIVDNISLVGNFHAQFNRILASASFDELLKKLREKGADRPIMPVRYSR